MSQLNENEYHQYYNPYIDFVINNGRTIVENLEDSLAMFMNTLSKIPAEKHEFRYREDKWTIKQLIQHLIASERIFAYRAFRFVRNDSTELARF